MNDITFPVNIVGPGSQPAEEDGRNLDILQLPSGMSTYSTPDLPEPEAVRSRAAAQRLLQQLLDQLQSYRGEPSCKVLDLMPLESDDRMLVDQVLGEGEVSVVVSAETMLHIQESVLAGVWRIRETSADGTLIGDRIEVAPIPSVVEAAVLLGEGQRLTPVAGDIPEGVVNAPPLLSEINERISAYRNGQKPHVINLTLLPQTPEDLAFLSDRLGDGQVVILSRGYGNCRISSTATHHVWWVQYFNSQDANILNTIEIGGVPEVARAAPEDIEDSGQRLSEILEIYI